MTASQLSAVVLALEAPSNTKRCSQTLKSIKKYSPSPALAKGDSNPLTLHSANGEVFARLWSFLAETMLVEGSLSQSTKEAISWLVASKLTGAAQQPNKKNNRSDQQDPFEVALHSEAMKYAERLMNNETDDLGGSSRTSNTFFETLSRSGKAEVALVVLLFSHLSRATIAVLGKQSIDTAMMNVSSSNVTRAESSKGVLRVVNRMIRSTPPKSHKSGATSKLFVHDDATAKRGGNLPSHLEGSAYAGRECANALARLVSWVDSYEEELLQDGTSLTTEILDILHTNVPPVHLRSEEIPQWVSVDMRKTLQSLPHQSNQDLANVLLLVTYSPESVSNSAAWVALTREIGKDEATTMVIWWSLRLTLDEAKGLRSPRRHSNDDQNIRRKRYPNKGQAFQNSI